MPLAVGWLVACRGRPAPAAATPAPRWAARLRAINNHLMFDLGGGPRPWKAAWVINTQKAGCLPFFAFLIWFYADQTPWATSTAAWTYLALHGSYGLVWLLKDMVFPDPAWQGRCTIPSALYLAAGLALLALRGGWADPYRPLVPAGMSLFAALLVGVMAVRFGREGRVYLSGLLFDLAAVLLWAAWGPHTAVGFFLANAAGLGLAATVWSAAGRIIGDRRTTFAVRRLFGDPVALLAIAGVVIVALAAMLGWKRWQSGWDVSKLTSTTRDNTPSSEGATQHSHGREPVVTDHRVGETPKG